ncbi:unnamed protein product [Eruca vesicaria subsp. sativa]|uniref:Uncharacterized protein n=1 Tax=Eruca vesicaria subsp. sativa TaxID=29727 RepID=A0ABC8KY21_ERUVS|nr:unnamed protein product [Eruca vesicaria subsp. sativa]
MSVNTSNVGIEEGKKKKKKEKVVVIMGPTGSGKSKLAVDLVSQFCIPLRILETQQFLLLRRSFPVPVLVGGSNYYIQALVSKFLLEDLTGDSDECCSTVDPVVSITINFLLYEGLDVKSISGRDGYELLRELDPVAANRVHPNNHRKINQYLSLHASRGVLPSKLYQEKLYFFLSAVTL